MKEKTLLRRIEKRFKSNIFPYFLLSVYSFKKKMMTILFENHNKDYEILLLDTALQSDNCGDTIIEKYCTDILDEVGVKPVGGVATHVYPSAADRVLLRSKCRKMILGTNLCTSQMNIVGTWRRSIWPSYSDQLLLFGVGWQDRLPKVNNYTKLFYRTLLDRQFLHSVRDSEVEYKLKSIGIQNVINTSCPTMWKLTEERCNRIPVVKGSAVVTTITDYCQDPVNDWRMLDILQEEYPQVYIWIQGVFDMEYLGNYPGIKTLIVVNGNLADFEKVISQPGMDYVGTRLHAGIHALNYLCRSIIIEIDNRAGAIAKDTGLPVIKRSEISKQLKEKIDSKWRTEIVLPIDAIRQWKQQFK